ncbi:extracellular solute-binding protein [Gorillibacterium sp. sgz5001074]|uniref:extracellular solute-binding protein n=1 Tax=Gorillibacterium sp. sgz5001074 TaxID=3446695 RepID=UPI003F66DB31
MKKSANRYPALVLSVCVTGGMALAGCSDKNEPSASPAASAPAASAGAAASPGGSTYPLKSDAVVTRWLDSAQFSTQLAVKPKMEEFPFVQELEKRTGVKEKYVLPAVNQAKEQLNIMFASGEYTDIIEWNFLGYPGGPEKAIKDGNILKLNDLIDKYAPNLKKYLKEHPDVDKQIKTDNGTYYGFPFIRGDDFLKTYGGPIVRKDWLDELGLPVPTTMDEWYTMLKAFKEKKGATAPLTFVSTPRLFSDLQFGAFYGAFGVKRDFYMENNKVKFGPMEPGFKDFLSTMRKWYAEGIIDPDIATVDAKIRDANMTSGKSGATYALAGGGIGKWLTAMKEKDPKYNVVGAPYPVLKKGDTPKFGQKDYSAPQGGNFAISPKAKNPELLVKALDYGYSEEGRLFYNFGIEGVSYTMVNGYPTYSDMIKKDYATNLTLYTRATGGPTIQDKRYYEQYAALPQQQEAVKTWMKTDVDKYQLPPISPTPEESTEFAKIINEANTLVDEFTVKVLLGTESVDSYDKFREKLKSLKIDRAVEIQQAALDRYNKR